MKPFLGTDRTDQGAKPVRSLGDFAVAGVRKESMEAYYAAARESARMDKRAKLPLAVRVFRGFMILMAAVTGMGIPSMLGDWQGLGEVAMVFGFCLGIVLLINRAARRRRERVSRSEEGRKAAEGLDEAVGRLYDELGVPQSAQTAEVLMFGYAVENGEIAVDRCSNIAMKAWLEDGALCIASLDRKFAFPLGEMRGIRTVRRQIILEKWHKPVPYNKEPYAACGMNMDEGDLYAKGFHILELVRGGEEWGIYFPEYELETYERLTGLKAG